MDRSQVTDGDTLSFKAFARADWVPSGEPWTLWVRCYAMPAVFLHHIARRRIILDSENLRVAVMYGSLTFFHVSGKWIEVTPQGQTKFRKPSTSGIATTPEGAYLLVLAPVAENAQPPLEVAEGMLAAVGGKAVVYSHVFDNEIHSDGRITAYMGSLDNPAWYDVPSFRDGEMDIVNDLFAALACADQNERTRIDLSLRWIGRAVRSKGVDSFLQLWVAIETLAMPDTSNIRPAESTLAGAYSLSLPEVRARFGLGRLQGIRANIVHDGSRVQIPGEILKYLEAIFFDLLSLQLHLPFQRRAETKLHQNKFSVHAWLTEAA